MRSANALVFHHSTMKLKQLQSALQCVPAFAQPNIALEQYPTSPHLASRMIHTIDSVYDDIRDRDIADFGCGCGMLTIAAALLDCGY
jgi:predicted RNA methylase